MSPDEITACFEDFGRGRLAPFLDRLADDVVLEFPGRRFGGRFEGARKVGIFLRRNQRLFDGGLRFHVVWAGVTDDRAVVQWTNEGITRQGAPYENRGVTVLELEAGRIVRIHDYLDTERLAETWPA